MGLLDAVIGALAQTDQNAHANSATAQALAQLYPGLDAQVQASLLRKLLEIQPSPSAGLAGLLQSVAGWPQTGEISAEFSQQLANVDFLAIATSALKSLTPDAQATLIAGILPGGAARLVNAESSSTTIEPDTPWPRR